MAAPTFGASGTAFSDSGAGVDIDAPDDVVDKSIVVAAFFLDGTPDQNVVAPAGWTAAEGSPVVATGHRMYVYWHRASGAESGPYSFTWDASVYREGQAHRYDACVTTGTPFDAGTDTAVDNTNGLVSPAVEVTTLGADRRLIHTATDWGGGTWTPNVSPAFTKRQQPAVGLCTLSDAAQATQGASGSITATCTGLDKRTAWLGALKPLEAATVTGTAAGALGGLAGTSSGLRTVVGVAGQTFGGLTASAVGVRTVSGTAAAALGPAAGVASGTRTVVGSAAGSLGALAGSGHSPVTVTGTAVGELGALAGHASGGVPAVVASGSWESLAAILEAGRQYAAEDAARTLVACPNDGTALEMGPDGVLFCRFDGWRPA